MTLCTAGVLQPPVKLSWTWHFVGANVLVTTAAGETTLAPDYDIGGGRLAGGVLFTHVAGPEIDDDQLEQLADDMERREASEFIPVSPKHYRRAS